MKAGPALDPGLAQKYRGLREKLRGLERLAVAFSGGVDSALLLKVAADSLGPGAVIALTARTAFSPAWELAEARSLASELGIRQLLEDIDVLGEPKVAANSPRRCYHCKRLIFGRLAARAQAEGFGQLADGANFDDLSEYRPGSQAAAELGILSPLREAALSKADIRCLSEALGLQTAQKPAFACLASRFPYDSPLNLEALKQVEAGEDFLRSLGFRQLRLRRHGPIARLELGRSELAQMLKLELVDLVNEKLKALGFAFVTLDLGGYRSGSLNELVPQLQRERAS